MLANIEWLFFDVGSTLVNEEKVYAHLIGLISEQAGRSYEEVTDMVITSYKNNQNGFKETVKELGAAKPHWNSGLEFLYEDACSVLKVLHTKYKIGIIANQELGCNQRLEKMGIAQYIDLVVCSAEEGVSKPDLKLFNIALSKSNCTPQNAIMIGDRIDNDIIPSKILGMRTIWIKQGYGQYWKISRTEEMPDLTVRNLSALLKILI